MKLDLTIDKGSSTPLYRQVVESIRAAITAGRLGPGDRLPSATNLARAAGIGRPTAVRALRELEAAGLVNSQVGRGSFVADPQARPDPAPPASDPPALTKPDLERIMDRIRSNHMRSIARLARVAPPDDVIDLRPGYPPDACVPDELPRLAKTVLSADTVRLGRYAPRGDPEFVDALVEWLGPRGYGVARDDVLVTNGSQDAISFLGMWAARTGRRVLCETPTWWGTTHAFAFAGHAIETVPWSGDRLRLPVDSPGPAILYCCPDFNNPTGRTLSAEGRRELVAFAERNDVIVVMDEIFRDLRFAGTEPSSLFEALPPSRRILISSFSKSFMPGLRVGYLVAQAPLIEELWSVKQYLDLGGPPLMQALTAAFLRDGYAEHLERVRAHYGDRQRATLSALARHMPENVGFTRPEGGFHLWVDLPEGASAVPVYLEGLEHGVAVAPGPMHDVDGGYRNCFRISYGHATPEEITRAVAKIAEITKSVLRRERMVPSGPPPPL